MHTAARGFVWGVFGFVGASLIGCHYSPYGPMYHNPGPYAPMPSYGPTMAPPGGYISPGPPYVPNSGSPTPLPGNPNSPTPLNSNSPTPTWRSAPNDDNSGLDNAPPFTPNPGANPVPDPLDPGFDAPGAGASVPRATPLQQASAQSYEEPRKLAADPFAESATAATTATSSPYGYDGKAYAWLRGIVDYDEPSQSWSIIYDLAPKPHDQFGGSFVFAPHESLKGIVPGTTVQVQGQADPGITDGGGKPLYKIQKLIVLAPPAGIQ
jgi:hypothetical protein